ncbi:MAG: DUF1365 domain-containing protein [Planctomycetota bacterium]
MSASAIYEGRVYHRRLEPRPHAFEYGLFLLYLDLDELPEVFTRSRLFSDRRLRPLRFARGDYLAPAERPLQDVARDRVEAALGRRPGGAVRLLTQVRTFGYVFNPVSFYYCFAADGELDAVVAEITNTPWGERHAYVLDARRAEEPGVRARFEKAFHVSPFFDLDQTYDWRFSAPGERLDVHMTNLQEERAVFHAGMTCERRELSPAALRRALVRHPLLTLRVHAAIYLQAALLWRKRAPFYVHPKKRAPLSEATPS